MPKKAGAMQTMAEKKDAALKRKKTQLRRLQRELGAEPAAEPEVEPTPKRGPGRPKREPEPPAPLVILPEIASSQEQVEAAVQTERRLWKFGPVPKYLYGKDMEPIIRQFFLYCIERQQPPLISSLSLALGFSSTHSFYEYAKKPEFTDILTRARLVCEDFAAKGLISGKNTVGFIFLLKQYGWRDVHENVVTYETHEQRIARLIRSNTGGS